jgi:hypothetical protein
MNRQAVARQQKSKSSTLLPPSKGVLQRRAVNQNGPEVAPPIVNEVLRTPGRPLDSATRAYMEPRFGHDFSRIPAHTGGPTQIQAKLAINKPGDKYEQEADRIADQVMRMPDPVAQRQAVLEEEEEDETLQMKPLVTQITPLVQREAIDEEEDEEEEIALQRQSLMEEEEDEELLQAKQTDAQVSTVTSSVGAAVQSVRKGGGQPLDPATRAFMEPRFGHDFGRVRIHTDSRAAAAARAVDAQAFTIGSDVAFGEGGYTPRTNDGLRLLAHELAHVLQQVSPASTLASRSPMLQRSISTIGGTERDIFDPAVRLADGHSFMAMTVPTLNGTEIHAEADGENAVRSPTFGGESDPKGGWECWIDSVPDNQAGYVISKLKPPPWTAKMPQSDLARLGVSECSPVSILADIQVHGKPSDENFMESTYNHEGKHAIDSMFNFYAAFEVWDKRLTKDWKKKSRFSGQDKSVCERNVFTIMGGTPEDRSRNWFKRNTKSAEDFHNTPEGRGIKLVGYKALSDCAKVDLFVE